MVPNFSFLKIFSGFNVFCRISTGLYDWSSFTVKQCRRAFFSNNARAFYSELVISDEMPEISNKNKGSKANFLEKIVQFTQCQLENLIETIYQTTRRKN